jgi:hypothetical protein
MEWEIKKLQKEKDVSEEKIKSEYRQVIEELMTKIEDKSKS